MVTKEGRPDLATEAMGLFEADLYVILNDRDTWTTAAQRRGQGVRTFHNFKGPVPGEERIDWILTRGPVACDATEIITFQREGQYPSDHFPVVAWLRWTAP